MPWSIDNPPRPAKNWSDDEKRKCVAAANSVLDRGGSEQGAIYACIHAAGKSKRGGEMRKASLFIVLFKAAPTAATASQAQLDAGNYRKKHIRWHGLDIAIEHRKGSYRRWGDPNGKHHGKTLMHWDYGYLKRSEGGDGDHVDCYIGPDPEATHVYVVHQRKAGDWGRYDEDKCMLNFPSLAAARQAYLQHYDDPRFLGPTTAMTVEEFRVKVVDPKSHGKMIKAYLFVKAHVPSHTRRLKSGKVVRVEEYDTKVIGRGKRSPTDSRQMSLIFEPAEKGPSREEREPQKTKYEQMLDTFASFAGASKEAASEAVSDFDFARDVSNYSVHAMKTDAQRAGLQKLQSAIDVEWYRAETKRRAGSWRAAADKNREAREAKARDKSGNVVANEHAAPTEKQVKYATSLAKKKGYAHLSQAEKACFGRIKVGGLNRELMSQLIDWLSKK